MNLNEFQNIRFSQTLLFEAVTYDVATIQKNLANPDIRPNIYDSTVESWIERISLWGPLEIEHKDPELKRKTKITKRVLISKIVDSRLNRLLGTWKIERLAGNKVKVYRTYYSGISGKVLTEEFIITVDIKSLMKKR